jgi:hypothetical protein
MPKLERVDALTKLLHVSSRKGMPLGVSHSEQRLLAVASLCQYAVKLKPIYLLRVRVSKVSFTYTFHLAPGLQPAGSFFKGAHSPNMSESTGETIGALFGYPGEGCSALKTRRPPHLPGNGG